MRPSALACQVLVVDDSEGNRRIARRMLQQLSCTVVEAADGDEVPAALARTAEDGGRGVGIVLMDVEMPRVSGSSAVTEARGAGWTLPIIAVTGNGDVKDRDTCACARRQWRWRLRRRCVRARSLERLWRAL
jgi:CheY-like chemotaxis protein